MEQGYKSSKFEHRVRQLNRRNLRDLYPSEAWSIYRIVPQCKSVLDLGCGAGDMAEIVRQISPATQYIGVDNNSSLIKLARRKSSSTQAKFHSQDALTYLEQASEEFDCIMAWAFLYSVENFVECLHMMVNNALRFVLFDMRVAKMATDLSDAKLAFAEYGGDKSPLTIASFQSLIDQILSHQHELKRVEISGYHFPIGKYGWVTKKLPYPSIVSVALEKVPPSSLLRHREETTEWRIKVPPDLFAAGENQTDNLVCCDKRQST